MFGQTGAVFARALGSLNMSNHVLHPTKAMLHPKPLAGNNNGNVTHSNNAAWEQHRGLFNKLYLMRTSLQFDFAQPNQDASTELLLRICNFPVRTKTGHLRGSLGDAISSRDVRIIWDNDTRLVSVMALQVVDGFIGFLF